MKLGYCDTCKKPAEARYQIRDEKVYLEKLCADCGPTSTLVTKNAEKWRWKRETADYEEPAHTACRLNCSLCDHQTVTLPATVAIDVTNRCNQRCPICLANVEGMGFDFHPPMEYFEKIFQHFKTQDPKPNICFFGGEPTVHDEFPEIVRRAKSHGFNVQMFTNGIKFANMAYCRELCSQGIQVNFSFDGTRPEIYKTLRDDRSLGVKRRALENVVECGVNKLTIISTMAEGVNDDNVAEMIDFIHEYKEHVKVWAFVPLTPCWEPDRVDLEPTTTECVEGMFEKIVKDIEFVPTGMMKFKVVSKYLGKQTLGGSHPNCESATLVVSDGESYSPISKFLNGKLSDILVKLRNLDNELIEKSARVPEKGIRRVLFNASTFLKTVQTLRGAIDLRETFPQPAWRNGSLAVLDLIRGKKIDEILSTRTSFKHVLTLMTIPYEDTGGLEDARLHDCPAVFAYEEIGTEKIKTAAFCSWQTIKDDLCRKIEANYNGEVPELPEVPAVEREEEPDWVEVPVS